MNSQYFLQYFITALGVIITEIVETTFMGSAIKAHIRLQWYAKVKNNAFKKLLPLLFQEL